MTFQFPRDGLLLKQTFLSKYPAAPTSQYMDYHLNAYIQVVLFRSISLFKKQNYVYRISGMDDETVERIFGKFSLSLLGSLTAVASSKLISFSVISQIMLSYFHNQSWRRLQTCRYVTYRFSLAHLLSKAK